PVIHQYYLISFSTLLPPSSLLFYFSPSSSLFLLFFFNDTPTTEIYTLSLHDALPISARSLRSAAHSGRAHRPATALFRGTDEKLVRAMDRAAGRRARRSHCQRASHAARRRRS